MLLIARGTGRGGGRRILVGVLILVGALIVVGVLREVAFTLGARGVSRGARTTSR